MSTESVRISLFKLNQKADFQQKVWVYLFHSGKTVFLYGRTKLGDVKAIRAVATANGKIHCGLLFLATAS
jgi:hypothetical protein